MAILQYNVWLARISRISVVFIPKKLEMKDLITNRVQLDPRAMDTLAQSVKLTAVERITSQL